MNTSVSLGMGHAVGLGKVVPKSCQGQRSNIETESERERMEFSGLKTPQNSHDDSEVPSRQLYGQFPYVRRSR